MRDWYSRAALAVLGLVLVVAVFGGRLAPDEPLAQDGDATFAPAGSAGHLLGTDYIGRDVLSAGCWPAPGRRC